VWETKDRCKKCIFSREEIFGETKNDPLDRSIQRVHESSLCGQAREGGSDVPMTDAQAHCQPTKRFAAIARFFFFFGLERR